MAKFFFVPITASGTDGRQLKTDAATRRALRTVVQQNARRYIIRPGQPQAPEHELRVNQEISTSITAPAATTSEEETRIIPWTSLPEDSGIRHEIGQVLMRNDEKVSVCDTASDLITRANESALIVQLARYYWPHSHRGSTFDPWTIFNHTSDVSKVADVARCSVLFLGVGNAVHDPGMIFEGKKRAEAAVGQLRQMVSEAKDQGRFDVVSMLVCIMYLLVGGLIRHESAIPDAWTKHVAGMRAILDAARDFDFCLPQRRGTFLRVRHLSLMASIWDREAPKISVRRLEYHINGVSTPGASERLTRLAMSLPVLLEHTDELTTSRLSQKRATSRLQSQLEHMELEFDDWLSGFGRSPLVKGSFCQGDACRSMRRSTVPSQLSPQAQILSHDTDGRCLPCFVAAHGFAFCHMCQVLVLQAQLELTALPGNEIQREPVSLREKADALADRLCEYVVFFDTVTVGILRRLSTVQGLLLFLSQHLKRTADIRRLSWCQTVEHRLRAETDFVAWDAAVPWSFLSLTVMFDYD